MSRSCTYIVPTEDEAVDRQCGKPAVSQLELPSKHLWLCRQHERKVKNHGQVPMPLA